MTPRPDWLDPRTPWDERAAMLLAPRRLTDAERHELDALTLKGCAPQETTQPC